MASPLIDTFGRVHRDLRISVTDRCDLRCSYCMPTEPQEWLDRAELLTFEEIGRVASVLVGRLGVTSIRLTGGEPTLRAELPKLVEALGSLGVDLSLTTNATTLSRTAQRFADAGLSRVNISLDTLRRDRFAELTGRDRLPQMLEGIDAAVDAGLDPVKINAVLIAGVNDDEIVDMARWAIQLGVELRFIEFMPLDGDATWDRSRVVERAAILDALSTEFDVEAQRVGSTPAEVVTLDGTHRLGVIPTVTEPFCDSCDRIRLTSDGAIKNCLFGLERFDVRSLLRSGASDDDLEEVIRGAVEAKWAGHGIAQPVFIRPPDTMHLVGG